MPGEYLLVTGGPAKGARLPVDGEVLLGRDGDVPGLSEDSRLSRHHARVVRGPGETISISDLGSVNGPTSAVRGSRHRTRCGPANVIQIGASTFELRADAPRPQAPADHATILHGGTRIALEAGGMTIGRAPDNSLTIGDERVSSHHARIDVGSQATTSPTLDRSTASTSTESTCGRSWRLRSSSCWCWSCRG